MREIAPTAPTTIRRLRTPASDAKVYFTSFYGGPGLVVGGRSVVLGNTSRVANKFCSSDEVEELTSQ